MKKKRNLALFAIAFVAVVAIAQNAPPAPPYYTETLRAGPTRITEDNFEIKVTSEHPVYKQKVRDATGTEHYELSVNPVIGEAEGNDKITAWQVSLRDLRHPVYGNMLQFDQELSENPRDNMFWLNPVHSAPVPIRSRRIFKVDAFYIAFQAKEYRFTPADSPYLEFMTIQLELSNSDPRNESDKNSAKTVGRSGTCEKLRVPVHL